MRIDIRMTTSGLHEQTRAYAEFKVFSALARFGREIDAVTVVLTPPPSHPGSVTCDVSVAFSGGGRLRVRARGGHAYEAINRAVDRLGDLLREEHPVAVPS